MHNLANHTSGFRIPTNFLAKTNAEIRDGSTLQGEVARLPEIGPAETPGSSFDYSNPGYKSSYLTDNGDHNGPHLMFFQREKNDATWGANVTNAPVVSVNYWYLSAEAYPQLKSFPPMAVFLVMVDKWSDGTPAPPM